MKPFVLFPDAVVETLRVLREEGFLDDEIVAEAGTVVSRKMPTRDADTVNADVLVADDGDNGPGLWPVGSDALMRISVWDASPYRAGRLAARAQAHLLAYSGDSKIRGFRYTARPFTSTDPDDGSPLSSFTIIARLRAE